jgi:RimJ/RimL family protein N-acetyltransferase
MSIENCLFKGNMIQMGPIDHENDPAIVSRWTHNAGFMRMMYTEPARPLSCWQVKKKIEELEKSIEENKNLFHFRIRTRNDERSVGFAEILWISWTNAGGYLRLGIGDRENWRKGYGTDAMKIILRYAFTELNLKRVTLDVFEYNQRGIHSYEKVGFVHEGRMRGQILREGRHWDVLYLGILREGWLKLQENDKERML